MPRKDSQEAAARLSEIQVYAHRIRKKKPKKAWRTCMKEAGAEYRRRHK